MGILDYKKNLKYSFKFRRIFRSGVDFALFSLGILMTFIVMPLYSDQSNAAETNDPTVASTLSFVSASDLATVSINPTSSGAFASSSNANSIRFSISTNNYTGYTLSVRSNKTTLDNGNASINSLTSSVTSTQFSTAANTQYNNRWGYRPNYYNSASNSRFLASPTTTATVLDKTTAANSTAKNYTIALGARIDMTLPAGTYVNDVFVLEYVANAVPYSISFNNNADGDIVNNMPSPISGEAVSAATIPLPLSMPTRNNYTFSGWCSVRPTEGAGGQVCSGVHYDAGAIFGMDYTANNSSVILYATWASDHGCNKAATTIGTGNTTTDAVCMQDINDAVISTMTTGSQYTLKDMRDDKPYFISKLADGKVWMTQNLNYNLDSTVTLTHDNTDLGYTTNEANTTWTPSADTLTSLSSWVSSSSSAVSYDHSAWYYPSSGSASTDTGTTTCDNANTCMHYNAGTFYNAIAAIAENRVGSSFDYTSMPDSVCPAGWRLFKGYTYETYSEFNTLSYLYGFVDKYASSGNLSITTEALNGLRSAPVYFSRSGSVVDGAQSNAGANGRFHSSVLVSDTLANMVSFSSTIMYPLNYTNYSTGAAVRCVARMSTGTTTVNFYGNGAISGTTKTIAADSGMAINLNQGNNFYKTNHKLIKWNTSADGTGTDYEFSDIVRVAPGTTTTVDLYAIWEPAYEIIYNGNNATSSASMNVNHMALNDESITLYAPNYLRTGYGFAGWSTTQINPDASNAAALMAAAKIYGPNETIIANYDTFGVNVPNNITLYAVWVKSTGTIQNWKGCNSLTTATYSDNTITPGSVIALTDSRDGNTYAIARLTDGNCWMIENLRLNAANSTDASKAQGFAGAFTGLANSEDRFTNSSFYANSKYSESNITGENQVYRIPRYNNNNTNYGGANSSGVLLETSATNNNNKSQWYGYGNYYNWAAAKANTEDLTNSDISKGYFTSICPSGWMLPYSGTSSTEDYSYRKLSYSLSNTTTTSFTTSTTPTGEVMSNRWRSYPTNYIYAGYYNDVTTSYRNTRGYYWAYNTSSASSASAQYFYSTQLTISGGLNKYVAASVRCVADNSYRLFYNGNLADSDSDMIVAQPAVAGSEITLYASNYKRTGYGFLGWSFTQIDSDAANAATQISNATIYGPNQTITLPSTINSNLTLYAVWIKSAGNMQNWTGCSSLAQGNVTALKDTRDNQVYAVAKLADGNCWMIENLRLNDDHSTDYSKMQGVGGVYNGLSESTTNFSVSTVDTPLYTINPRTTNKNFISGDYQEHRFPKFNNDNTSNTVSHMVSGNQNIYSYGNYYNFAAAMANTSVMTLSSVSENTGSSLCPTGWVLPTAGSSTSGKQLNTLRSLLDTSAKIREYPNNFIYSGSLQYTSLSGRGTAGDYASRSVNDNDTATYYYLNMLDSNYQHMYEVSSYAQKIWGHTIRCIRATSIPVTLDANDGSGKYEIVYGEAGNSITLPISTVFMKDDMVVTSWNTSPDGSGTSYTTSYTPQSAITLYAQWTPAYVIQYDGNGETTTTHMTMYAHSGIASGGKVLLYDNNVLRNGYGFVGWSTTQIDPDAANAATLIKNAKILGPNETITANATTLGVNAPATVTLYAVWIKSSGTMQNWNGCDSLTAATYSNGTITPGDVVGLTDERDNKVYAVSRLSDGQCWMIEALHLNPRNSTISTTNTNFPASDYFTKMTSSSSSWCSTNSADCIDRVNGTGSNLIASTFFYNWYTATAGNGNYAMIAGTAAGDICPAGWHLSSAAYNSSSDFFRLAVSLGGSYGNMMGTIGASVSERLRTYPNNFRYYGYGNPDSNGRIGQNNHRKSGYYIGTNATSERQSYMLYMTDSSVYLSNYSKYLGYTVSCIKNPKIVRYDGNGADDDFTMRVTHPATPSSSVNLYASNYKRDGYGFLGWSFTQIDPDATNVATQISNATIYGPNQTITLPSTINGDLTLYAVWVKSSGNLQSWSGCSSLAQGSVTALKDTRDNQVYAVAKLADGNCWMIENLRLSDDYSYDASKSQGYGGVFNGLAESELTTFYYSNISNSLYSVGPESDKENKIIGDYSEYRVPRYNNVNTANTVSIMQNSNQNIYSYGNYYNYAAAIANTSSITPLGDGAGTSVCPLGWRLPTGGEGKDFSSLMTAVSGATNLRSYPNNFIFSGYLWSYNIQNRGSYGEYYSSTSSTPNGAYDFQIYSDSNYQHRSVNRSLGLTIRCVINPSQYTVTLNSNDGTNRLAHLYGASGTSVSLQTDTFNRDGYKLVSWNTQANGSGTSYTSAFSFTGNQTLYAQWVSAYKITYNGNGDGLTTDMITAGHENVGTGDEIMLYANNYIRNGYGFLGWSPTQINPDASNATTLIANAKIYGPNQTIAANSTTLGVNAPATVTLYAVWLKASGTFQNWKGCDSLTSTNYNNGTITPGSYVALTDTRGTTANTYAIAKLSDGKCWMIEDARFDVENDNMTLSNTNFPTSEFLSARTTISNPCTINTKECADTVFYSNGNNLSRGVYYNWHTATAGHAHFGSTVGNGGDICPAGWKIPLGSTSYDFGDLFVSVGAGRSNYDATTTPTGNSISRTLRSFPYNFTYNGNTLGTAQNYYRSSGYYMSSLGFINDPNNFVHYLYISDTLARLSYGTQTQYGVRVRCVYNPTIIYDGNGATSGTASGIMRPSGSTVVLATHNFKKTGYGFIGWSLNSNGSGTVYGPNETVSLSELSANSDAVGNIRLYAVWVPVTGNIQNWTGCNSLAVPSVGVATSSFANVTALTDTRDGEVYAVARYADGNCYMINDLRLGDSSINVNLTSANTNLSSTINKEVFNGWVTPTFANSFTDGIALALKHNYDKPGVMYNYCAASAGTVCTDSESINATYDICPAGWRLPYGGSSGDYYSLSNNYGYNTSALARKSAVNGGLGIMLSTTSAQQYYSSTLLTSSALNATTSFSVATTTADFFSNSSLSKSGLNAVRCVLNKPTSSIMVYYGTGVSSVTVNGAVVPNYGNIRLEQGVSVPIVMYLKPDYAFSSWSTNSGTVGVSAQTSTYTPGNTDGRLTANAAFVGTYIQNLASSQCTTTAKKVYDSRDMQAYYVKRLSDGKCWMMDNLNLGANAFYVNLTSSNSNLATTISYSTFNGWKKTTSASTYTDGEFMPVAGTDPTSNTAYGTLYNYYAATGGTISGDSNSTDATYDICPAGWRLPTGTTSGELATLYSYYNTYALMRAPYTNNGAAFNLPGWFGGGSSTGAVYKNMSGSFWASTTYNPQYRHSLYLSTSEVQNPAGSIRSGGHSIRCIMGQPKSTLTVNYSAGVASVSVNGTTVINGGTISLAQGASVPIVMYLKGGYSFSSWSATSGTVGVSSQTSTYTIGTSNATLTANATFTGTRIQNLSASSCTSSPLTVYDSRDDQAYVVQRLADGKCWMVDSLKLGNSTISVNLTSSNSNLSTTVTAATFNSWRNTQGSTTTGGLWPSTSGTDSVSGRAYGANYNYYAVSGGTITGDSNSSSASYDICPAGWRLPTGVSNTGDFAKLYAVYNSQDLLRNPTTSGGAAFSYTSSTSTYAAYWSSTYHSSTAMRNLYIANGYVQPDFNGSRALTYPVRCVLKNDIYSISNLTYLQDFNTLSDTNKANVINNMYYNKIYRLIDNRDNQTYQIAKFKDGYVWMAQNMVLGNSNISTNLTSSNTNIASTISYSTFNNWRVSNMATTLTAGQVMSLGGTDSTTNTPLGVLYNYCAATGGTVCSSTNSSNATYDLCPAGWRLPATAENPPNEVFSLSYAFGHSYATIMKPVPEGGGAFVLAGFSTGGTLIQYSGQRGDYWTSSAPSGVTTSMYVIDFDTSSFANAIHSRSNGDSIRCHTKYKGST